MHAVNREELKGLARVLNLPIFYPNLGMFTFKTRLKFNIMVKKMNKFASLRFMLKVVVVYIRTSS
jgi:hypothetical protein